MDISTLKNPFPLTGTVQHYAWGKPARESLVCELAGADVEPDVPCAELWFGAHPKAPAVVQVGSQAVPLTELLAKYPEILLGTRVSGRFGSKLPFLFKVLSIGSALSIQTHPDQSLAKALHAQNNAEYPDQNHKPEVAVALSEFTLLHGFRPDTELEKQIQRVPELRELAGNVEVTDIKMLYTKLMTADQEQVRSYGEALCRRLEQTSDCTTEDEWVLRLAAVHGAHDVGIFSVYLMNLITLQRGQGIFTEPGVPHAYLSGDLVECMANSDNVIRAGLTAKSKDISTLLKIVNYNAEAPQLLEPKSTPGPVTARCYGALADEFRLTELQGAGGEINCVTHGRPELIVCIRGKGTLSGPAGKCSLKRGAAYFIPAALAEYALALDGVLFRVRIP